MTEPKYCIKVLYTGGEGVRPGEVLVGFYRARDDEDLQYLYEHGLTFDKKIESYFPVPYQFPTFYNSKWDAITAAFQMQAILERNKQRQVFKPEIDNFLYLEYFCKAWEWSYAEFFETNKANERYIRDYTLRYARAMEPANRKKPNEW